MAQQPEVLAPTPTPEHHHKSDPNVKHFGDMTIVKAPIQEYEQLITNDQLIQEVLIAEFTRNPKTLNLDIKPNDPATPEMAYARFGHINETFATINDIPRNQAEPDKPTTNEAYFRAVAQKTLDSTGVQKRYRPGPPEAFPDDQQMFEKTAAIGADTLQRLIESKGWNDGKGIEGLIVVGSYLPVKIRQMVIDRVRQIEAETSVTLLGDIPKDNQIDVRTYCAGVATALTLAQTLKRFKNTKRLAILVVEPLGHYSHPDHFFIENMHIPAIFGSGYGAIGYSPDNHSLLSALIKIIPGGGIGVAEKYEVHPEESQETFQGHTMTEEINSALDEPIIDIETPGAQDIIAITPKGIFIKSQGIPKELSAQGIHASMDGPTTGQFFKEHTPPVITKVITQTASITKRLGNKFPITSLSKKVYSHIPALGVGSAINKVLKRDRRRQGLSEEDAPQINLSLLDEGLYNGSSFTLLNVLFMEADKQPFYKGDTITMGAPGIGSAIVYLALQRKPSTPAIDALTNPFISEKAKNNLLFHLTLARLH